MVEIRETTPQGVIYQGFPEDLLQNTETITCESYEIDNKQFAVLDNVFSETECDDIIMYCETCGFESLSHVYAEDYRKNDRVMVYDIPLADKLYDRIISILICHLGIDPNKLVCMNPLFRISKYIKSGFFAPHYDTPVTHNELISTHTVLAYLNDVEEKDGGATRFYSDIDKEFRPICVRPRKGSMVIFPHNIGHDGEEVYNNVKYIIRTDMMRFD